MYKVIWLTKFRPDLPREQVLEWWRGHHGDVAKATPGMLRYVQSHWVSALDPATHQPKGAPNFDGHAEHWFENKAAYDAAMASPEWAFAQVDGQDGFASTTLIGAELEETVISWHPMDDGRAHP
jgi:uncharacterized protein (TIGR02118 family)